jgi:hypothetical protein
MALRHSAYFSGGIGIAIMIIDIWRSTHRPYTFERRLDQ